jgi:hypothetical protein
MQTLSCQACGSEQPMREMFDIQGRTLCGTCGEQFFREQGGAAGDKVQRHVDPTVCVNCGADNGKRPHELLMRLPTCGKCIDFYRNRPYPKWVQVSFVALVVLVVVSLGWNWRFFQGHSELKAALAARNLKEAVEQADAAAKHVPEVAELQELAAYFNGVLCLQEDKCEQAQACLSRCSHLPPGFKVPDLLEQAAAAAAFNRKDYDKFLQVAESVGARNPNDSVAQAQVASALACVYAVRGDEQLRRRAEAKLEEARNLAGGAIKDSNYEERIRHRMQTREIINRQEFSRRFPNGWKSSGGSKP